MHILSVLIILYIYLLQADGLSRTKQLYIAGLYPVEGEGWTAPLLKVMGDLAVEYIHNTSDILPDYNITIDWSNSACDSQTSVREFIKFTQSDKLYTIIFGPACSISVGPVAELAPSYYLNIFSYAATSPTLRDKTIYPTLTLGTPSFIKSVVIWTAVIKYFQWRRVCILYTNNILFIRVGETLEDELKNANIETNTERIERNSDKDEYVKDIKRKLRILFSEQNYRIVVGNFYEEVARDVICLAYQMGFAFPKVTWLLPGWYSKNWFEERNSTNIIKCTAYEIMSALRGSLAGNGIPSRDQILQGNLSTMFPNSQQQIYDRFIERGQKEFGDRLSQVDTNTTYVLYLFDSIVSIALALTSIEDKYPGLIETFDYKNLSSVYNEKLMEELNSRLSNASFSGLTGQVLFLDNVRIDPRGQIFEWVNGRQKLIHRLYKLPNDGNTEGYNEFQGFDANELTYFGKQTKPQDGVILYSLPVPVYVIIILLMLASTVYVIVFAIIHIIYRRKKVFRLSSPVINGLILIGCFIQILAVIPYLFDNLVYNRMPEQTDKCWYCTLMCHLRYIIPAIATDLIFGSLIGKSFRVYMIAVRQSFGNTIHDWKIIIFVLILIAIDLVYNLLWAAIPSIRLEYISNGITENDIGFGGNDAAPFRILFSCVAGGAITSPARWVHICYLILRSALYVVGIFIAFLIRKVKIKGVNEFVSIAYATLVTIMLIFLKIFLSEIIFEWYDFALTLICLSLLLNTTIVVSFLFIPKLYFVISDPEEKKMYNNAPLNISITDSTVDKVLMATLKNDIQMLQLQKDNLKIELENQNQTEKDGIINNYD